MAQAAENFEDGIMSEKPAEIFVNENAEISAKKRSRVPIYIVGGIVVVSIIAGLGYWLYSRQFETTDDAFVEGNIIQISPKISAYVTKIHIKENQPVKKGDLLVELDSRDYENKLEQAQAQLKVALAQNEKALANVSFISKTANAGVRQASSNFDTAKNGIEQSKITADSKQTSIEQARNGLKTADANFRQIQAEIPSAEANLAEMKARVPAAQANLEIAQNDFERYQTLLAKGDISKQGMDKARKELSLAQAEFIAAQKQTEAAQARLNAVNRQAEVEAARMNEAQTNITAAENDYRQSVMQINTTTSQANESAGRLQEAQAAPERIAVDKSDVASAEAQVAQAQAAVHQAELELSYTKIYAPDDGFVSRKAVQEGELVQPDQTIIAISQSKENSNSDVWIIANFKETQIERIKPGQIVDVYIDAYPNVTFRGRVDSFQAGTGSRFSVFPAENATGNFVKVVQRIPVKIVFDEGTEKINLLVPGMSAVPRVKVR
ncbi:MAG: efflux RND transporter periplasmic adaptor subunit [Pyrinomonadaceae bacterium]